MSTINTNNIDSNYPIPGVNNSSQGFRTNFTSIKNNLDIAGNEITDLQNKVVVKQALNNQVLNNDMANTLISNASVRSFRHTTYNLGNALVGTVLVNTSLGDVQYGTLSGNITLNFGNWAPTNTQSAVELQLVRPNVDTNFTITFENNAEINPNSGWSLLENSGSNGGFATLTFPYDVTQINLTITSTDCGNTLFVQPTNRPFKTTQIQQRSPSPTGFPGDVSGTVAIDPSVNQLTLPSSNTGITLSSVVISNTSGGFTCSATSLPLAIGQQLIISGTIGGTGSITGYSDPTTYYIINTNGSTNFQLSTTSGGANIATTAGTPTGLIYKVNNGYFTTTGNTSQLYPGMAVVFTGTSFEANIIPGTTYFVRNVVTSNTFTVSSTNLLTSNVDLSGSSGNMFLNPITYMYVATDDFNASAIGPKNVTATTAGTNIITLNNTTSFIVNAPIYFSGTTFGGIVNNTVYYIKTISGNNITVSKTRTNGVADTAVTLTTAFGSCTATAYIGNDIWKRIQLNSW